LVDSDEIKDTKGEEDAEKEHSLKKGVDDILNPEPEVPSPPVEQKPPVPEQSDSKGNDLQSLPSEEELLAESIVKNDAEEVSVATKTVDAELQEESSEQDVEASVSDETVKDSKPEIETEPEVAPVPQKAETEPALVKPEETVLIEPYEEPKKTYKDPKTPKLGKITDEPIEVLHSIGDIHGWAPGLISYLIKNKLAEIEVNGSPLQDKNGNLHQENLEQVFPNPIKVLKYPSAMPPKAGLGGQPGFDDTGINHRGHESIKARWIAKPNVALVQIGDIYDRADHSELASEVLRQLMIDAPGKVFVLVGNHEQFMLEEDYDNWYFNESRNAFTDSESRPGKDTRNHFRFLPTWDGKTIIERANATFERYINSTWTLFLTQGAIMEKLGWIKPDVDLEPMLEGGWSGYEHAKKMKKEFDVGRWGMIPGAITALVIADTLFHHAEPAAHRTDEGQGLRIPLNETMVSVNSKNNNILFRQYTPGGGNLKGSPDAPLLWSRGSSSGASSGNPTAESHLEGLTKSWPGLRRIVHGHTPTPSSGHFDSVTNGKSTTVSYLGESASRQATKGRANKIRIYNIDEGMSPPYYIGDDSIYSPTRMPTGLRIEVDEYSAIEGKSASSQLVRIDSRNSIDVDARKLWRWAPKQWRSSLEPNWASSDSSRTYQSVTHGSWRGYLSTDKNSGESTRGLLDRNAGTTQISKLMIQKMMTKLFSINSVKVQEPRAVVMERIPQVGKLLSNNKVKDAWNQLNVILVLLKPNVKGGFTLICINSTKTEEVFELVNFTGTKKGKGQHLSCEAKTITYVEINKCERLFVSRNGKSITQAIQEWNDGKDEVLETSSSPVIAYYSDFKKPEKKLVIKTVNEIKLVAKPAPVNSDFGSKGKRNQSYGSPKKNDQVSSRSYGTSSQDKATSIASQGSDYKKTQQEKARNQQRTLESQNSNRKASHQQQTQRKSNSLSNNLAAQGTQNSPHPLPPAPVRNPPPRRNPQGLGSSSKKSNQDSTPKIPQSQPLTNQASETNSQNPMPTSHQNKKPMSSQSKTSEKATSNSNENIDTGSVGYEITLSSGLLDFLDTFGFLKTYGKLEIKIRFEPKERDSFDSYRILIDTITAKDAMTIFSYRIDLVEGIFDKSKLGSSFLGSSNKNDLFNSFLNSKTLKDIVLNHRNSLIENHKKMK